MRGIPFILQRARRRATTAARAGWLGGFLCAGVVAGCARSPSLPTIAAGDHVVPGASSTPSEPTSEPVYQLPLGRTREGAPTIPVRIGKSPPLVFVVDPAMTGSEITLATARSLRVGDAGAASAAAGEGMQVPLDHLRVGSRTYEGLSASIETIAAADRASGEPVAGLLGRDFFSLHDVEIDFPANLIRLHPRDSIGATAAERLAGMVKIPYREADARGMTIPVHIDGGPEIRALVSLGDGESLIDWTVAREAGIEDELDLDDYFERKNAAGQVTRRAGHYRFDRVDIDSLTFPRPRLAAIWQSPPAEMAPYGFSMLIGNELLRDRVVVLDYEYGNVYLSGSRPEAHDGGTLDLGSTAEPPSYELPVFRVGFALRAIPASSRKPAQLAPAPWPATQDLIAIPVRIGDGPMRRFLIDTGMTYSSVTPDIAAELHLHTHPGQVVHAVGGEIGPFRQAHLEHLKVGPREYELGVMVADFGLSRLFAGDPIVGILGRNFLARHDVEMDFRNDRLRLHPRGTIAKRAPAALAGFVRIPFYDGLRRYVMVTAQLDGGAPIPAMIDWGAAQTIVSPRAPRAAGVDPNRIMPDGLSGGADGRLIPTGPHHFKRLLVGGRDGIQAISLVLQVGDIPSLRAPRKEGDDDVAMILGADLFRRTVVLLDYAHHLVYWSDTTAVP